MSLRKFLLASLAPRFLTNCQNECKPVQNVLMGEKKPIFYNIMLYWKYYSVINFSRDLGKP